MEAEVKKNSLKSRIIKTEPIDWRALRFIQQDKFKDLDLSARHRLKSSLVANNFSQPFYVWEDEDNGVTYCLDGKHRTALLEELIAEGYLPEYFADSSLEYTDNGAILSVFDPVLCEVMYRWFCVNGGQIFDPFAGGSVRGIVAGMLGYGYLGIDLRKEQVEANERQKREIAPNADIQWVTGNSINTSEICGGIKADFVFSCPPYFDLEVYSDNEEDLSNMSWDKFREQYGEIIRQSVDMLNDDSFACFVVGEVRDKKTGYYRKLINETVNAFERAGAAFYNELILVNVAGSLPIRAASTFKSRKIGKCHQNVLVFYKGDVSKIKSKFPDSDFSIAGPDFISENQ
jgi:hypothetical protein